MRLKAAFEGDLKKYMKAEFVVAEKAVTLGIRETTNGVKAFHAQAGSFIWFGSKNGEYVARGCLSTFSKFHSRGRTCLHQSQQDYGWF
jgi:AMMECR1 domain-containing protein